jgi:hypothetical protein
MSGLKINFMKNEVFVVNGDNDVTALYASMFICQVGSLPMKYLGVSVSFSKLKVWNGISWMLNC